MAHLTFKKVYPTHGKPYVAIGEDTGKADWVPHSFAIKVSAMDRVSEPHKAEVRKWNEQGADWEGVKTSVDWDKVDEKKAKKAFDAKRKQGLV